MSRRRSLLSSVAVALCALGAVTPLAGAASPVDTLSVAQTAAGKQLVLTGSPADDRILLSFLDPYGPQDIVRITSVDALPITFVIEGSAQDRCTFHLAEPGGTTAAHSEQYAICKVDGLLDPTPTIKPLRVDLSSGGNDEFIGGGSVVPAQIEGGDDLGDTLGGTEFDDLITGGPGNDNLNGEGGDDVIHGGAGDDWLGGGDGIGDDTLDGGPGNDILFGDLGSDTLVGGPGDDFLHLMERIPFSDTWEVPPTGAGDVPDKPSSCGEGDDTAWRFDAAADPLTADASCETDVLEPSLSPMQVHGTLAAGSTLTVTREVHGAQPTRRVYAWMTCDNSGQSEASGCIQRSTCQTFRLEAEDVGKLVFAFSRELFPGSDDRYEIRPDDARVAVSGRVGAAGPAGVTPGAVVAGTPARYVGTWAVWWRGSNLDEPMPHQPFFYLGRPFFDYRPASHLQTDCPSLDMKGAAPGAADPTRTPTPAAGGGATPGPSTTPGPTPSPTLTPGPTSTPGPTPTAMATAGRAATPLSGAGSVALPPGAANTEKLQTQRLAKALASALSGLPAGSLRRGGPLDIAVLSGRLSLKVQVHPVGKPKLWVTVARGVAAAGAKTLDVASGPVGRKRLSSAGITHGHVAARVVVALTDRGAVSISTRAVSLRR